MDTKSLVRKVALCVMIFFDVANLCFWLLAGHWGFFWTFLGINIVVIAGELMNNFWWYGKTLSTEAKHKIEEGRSRRVYIYSAIASMVFAIIALAVHLGYV